MVLPRPPSDKRIRCCKLQSGNPAENFDILFLNFSCRLGGGLCWSGVPPEPPVATPLGCCMYADDKVKHHGRCPRYFIQVDDKSCYYPISRKLRWKEAVAACRYLNSHAHPVAINHEQEQAAVLAVSSLLGQFHLRRKTSVRFTRREKTHLRALKS